MSIERLKELMEKEKRLGRGAYPELDDAMREALPGLIACYEALELAKTRIEILQSRMRGCHGNGGEGHPVSEIEIPGWLEEIDAALAKVQPPAKKEE